MPIMFLIIGLVICVVLIMFALFLGGIGMVSRGPKPSEGREDLP